MLFEFNNQLVAQSALEINDSGNCAIECKNDEDQYFYIIIKTTYGTTTIVFYGPLFPDFHELPNDYTTNLSRMVYNQAKLEKNINFILNNKSYKITSAKEVSMEEALSTFVNLKQYLEEGGY